MAPGPGSAGGSAGTAPVGVSDAGVLAKLKSVFGYDSFRPLQTEIVRSLLQGRDVFVLMPTGGGKSLCFQLPALLMEGTAVVVSPLIALMKDQVDALQALGVPATFINSSLDPGEISRRQAAVARGQVKLLYVAPERLMSTPFLGLLSGCRISFFAIDEAHCISEWGHDFRPEYRELIHLRELFPSAPQGAFTATATRRVRADIRTQLRLERAACFQGSFNRPNLFYQVWPKRKAYDRLAAYLRKRGRDSGIIYCLSRKSTETLALNLTEDGFSAAAYHAGLESEERRRRQEAFIRDDVRIIVATIAFGMGIDKPDVRFVIHYDVPKNLEGYYQESGRGGRDGQPADCILFFSQGDVIKHSHFIDEKPTPEERRVAGWQLQQMAAWATSLTCRRKALLAYFDETFEGQPDPCCDLCSRPVEGEDCTIPAQMYLSCVLRTGEMYSSTHVIRVLLGSRDDRIVQAGHDRLSTYGIGRDRSREEWNFLAEELLRLGYVALARDGSRAVAVTPLGRAVLFKKARVLLQVPLKPDPEVEEEPLQPHPDLFQRLRDLRKRLADERGVPPYVIFPDLTLRQMAAELPSDRAGLLRISGVGERKAEDLGEAFLACIAEYARETGAQPVTGTVDPLGNRRGRHLPPSVRATLALFNRGMGVAEVAAERGFAVSTIEGHLSDAMETGEPVDVARLVPEEKRRAIEAAFAREGTALLRPVMDLLGEGYSFSELRWVRAAMLHGRGISAAATP